MVVSRSLWRIDVRQFGRLAENYIAENWINFCLTNIQVPSPIMIGRKCWGARKLTFSKHMSLCVCALVRDLETRIEVLAWLSNWSAVETFYVKYEIYYLEKAINAYIWISLRQFSGNLIVYCAWENNSQNSVWNKF